MNSILKVFKYVAFLNIPLMAGGLYYAYRPFFVDGDKTFYLESISMALLLVGFGMTMTSLRDVKKIDKMGRFIIERPKFFKHLIYLCVTMSLLATFFGLYLLIIGSNQFGIGLTSFGLGFLSLAKSLIDQAKDLTKHY